MNHVLRISEAASLALHATALLAAGNGQTGSSTKALAGVLGASEHHLAKVLQRLTRAGILASVRGPRGGFVLRADPQRTSLLEVYQAIDGPLPERTCLLAHKACPGSHCIMGNLIESLNENVRHYLTNTRLADLARVFSESEERT